MCALHIHLILDATQAGVQVMYIACLVVKWLCVHCYVSDDNDLFCKQTCRAADAAEANDGCVVRTSLTSSSTCFLLQGTKVKLEEALDQVAESTHRLESTLAEQMSAQTAAVQLRTSLEDSLAEVRSAFLPQPHILATTVRHLQSPGMYGFRMLCHNFTSGHSTCTTALHNAACVLLSQQ